MIHGILMSKKTLKDLKVDAHIAVLHTKVDSLLEKQKELTARVRANEKVVAAVTLLGTVALAVIGAGYFAPKAEAEPRYIKDWEQGKLVYVDSRDDKPLVIVETYHHMVDSIRNWKMQKERTPVEDSISNALDELNWIEEE